MISCFVPIRPRRCPSLPNAPEPVRPSERLAPRRTIPVDETVADAAASVLRRTQRNGVWTVTVQEEDLEARIQNILNDVLERPSPDVALARAASQYQREDLMGSCTYMVSKVHSCLGSDAFSQIDTSASFCGDITHLGLSFCLVYPKEPCWDPFYFSFILMIFQEILCQTQNSLQMI